MKSSEKTIEVEQNGDGTTSHSAVSNTPSGPAPSPRSLSLDELEADVMLSEADLEEMDADLEANQDEFLPDAYFGTYPDAQPRSLTEVIIGTDDRVRINPTTSFPWRAICALRITAANGNRYIGTGWLISPRTVITAGHCVFMHAAGGWVRSIEVIPGLNGALRPYGSGVSTNFRSVSGWVSSPNPNFDYGAIILPPSYKPGLATGLYKTAVLNDAQLLGMTLNLSGYPGDKGGSQQWFHYKRPKSVNSRRIVYDIDTMGGQSGSPVWYKSGVDRFAVGIHTNGHASGNSATRIVPAVRTNLNSWASLGL
ncbi:MAG: serine protease [Saprospiraceae bacterium]|nr:serine protease [Saprospiraceae bacterium]